MANVYKPGLLQVRPHYTQNDVTGHVPQNVLWFQSAQTTTPTIANLQQIAVAFDPGWAGIFGQYGAQNNYYTGSTITDWSSNAGLQYTSVGTFTQAPGGKGVSPHSGQVALLVSYQIAVRYKGGHPRTYLPYVGIAATQGVSNDEVIASVQTGVVTAMNAMISSMKGNSTLGGQTMVIYRHRQSPALATTYPFSTFTVGSQTATQRRRIRRVPHH